MLLMSEYLHIFKSEFEMEMQKAIISDKVRNHAQKRKESIKRNNIHDTHNNLLQLVSEHLYREKIFKSLLKRVKQKAVIHYGLSIY